MARRGLLGHLDERAVALNVPTDAAATTEPRDGKVACIHCGQRVTVGDCDLCGLGYRCRACCDRVALDELEGRADVADHLTIEDRTTFAERGRQLAIRAAVVGALFAVAGTITMALWPSPYGLKPFLTGLVVVLAVGGKGLSDWRRFRVR